jgi:glycosyltransferase involved in cell wall biosynthesis
MQEQEEQSNEPVRDPAQPEPGADAGDQHSGTGEGRRRRRRSRRRRPQDGGEAEREPRAVEQTGPPEEHPARADRGRQHPQPRQQGGGTHISVVIPLYNEEGSLRELHRELRAALGRLGVRHDFWFIDDGSTDGSFEVLKELRRADPRVKIIRFRRNYGKSAALSTGFEHAQGDIVVTMDADLQDDPAEIPTLVKKLGEGYDLVSGWKKVRKDPLSKTLPSRFFNWVTAGMTGIPIHDFNCGLKAYRRDVVKTVKVYGELHRYVPVLAHEEGFRVGEAVVRHRARRFGQSKFGITRFWKGFLDLLTVLFTTRYFRNPLHLFGFWGLIAMLAGVGIDTWLVVEWFLGQTALGNRPLFLVGILLIIVGIQMISIGLLGEMITKTRQEKEDYSIREILR